MKTLMLNCEIGDVIQYNSPLPWSHSDVLAVIIGAKTVRGFDRWLILPLGDNPRKKPYMIKKVATVWKKVT